MAPQLVDWTLSGKSDAQDAHRPILDESGL